MLMPGRLRPGSHIRIISPGLPTLALIPDRAGRADRALRALGFHVSYGEHARGVSSDGMMSGTAAERAADLMTAFLDPSVDAIFISDSGRGSRELIPWLDAADITANLKPFIGYCDTIFLNQYLASCAGISSFFGCAFMIQFGEAGGPFPETLDCFQRALMSPGSLVCRPAPSRTSQVIDWYVPASEGRPRSRDVKGGWTWLRPGHACGPFLGGEISLLPDMIREFGIEWHGAVLFWDVALFNKRPVRPQLEALCRCADLSGLAGMVVGAHPRIEPGEWAATVSALVRDLLPGTGFPVLVNADISHVDPAWLVPYAEQVILDYSDGMVFPRIC